MGLLPQRTARFEAFVAPAAARPQLWRLGTGALLACAVWLGSAAVPLWLARGEGPRAERTVIVVYLFSFGALILGLALAARLLQRRSPASLIGPQGFRPGPFAIGMIVVLALTGLGMLPGLAATPPVRQLELRVWLAWLPLALPALLIQTAAEEMAFRGYLMQGLAARFRPLLAWWLPPAVLFGLLHWNPAGFGANAPLVVAAAGLTGLILGDVAARTGNLSAGIGLHFANNAVALLLLAPPSPLGALSLWSSPANPSDGAGFRAALLADMATMLVAYGGWLWLCARRARLHSAGPGSI